VTDPEREELRRVREEIVMAHFRAENAGDIEGVIATFARPRYEMIHVGRTHEGADEVRGLLTALTSGFPDLHAEPGRLRHMDDGVFVECVTTGTHQGFFAGVPATGKRIETQSACIFEFEGDELVCERVYINFVAVLRQLGAIGPDIGLPPKRPDTGGPQTRPDIGLPPKRPDTDGPQTRPDTDGPQTRPDIGAPQKR
jgi:steroid delta-isomerase-like uncharacterized protein